MDTRTAANDLIAAREATRFEPVYTYDSETDSFRLFAKDVPKFANRLNPCFTMFLSYPEEELVGFEINKFSRLLHKMRMLPAFSILFTDSTVKVTDSVDAALLGWGSAGMCDVEMEDGQINKIHLLLKSCHLEESSIDVNSMQLCED